VVGAFAPQICGSQTPQFAIDERHQLFECSLVALAPTHQPPGYVGRWTEAIKPRSPIGEIKFDDSPIEPVSQFCHQSRVIPWKVFKRSRNLSTGFASVIVLCFALEQRPLGIAALEDKIVQHAGSVKRNRNFAYCLHKRIGAWEFYFVNTLQKEWRRKE
jgi:hypothetical protein